MNRCETSSTTTTRTSITSTFKSSNSCRSITNNSNHHHHTTIRSSPSSILNIKNNNLRQFFFLLLLLLLLFTTNPTTPISPQSTLSLRQQQQSNLTSLQAPTAAVDFTLLSNSQQAHSDSINSQSTIKYYKTNFNIQSTDSIYISLSPCLKVNSGASKSTPDYLYLYIGANSPNIANELQNLKMVKTNSIPIEYSISNFNLKNNILYLAIKSESDNYQSYELTVSTTPLPNIKIQNKKISLNLFKQYINMENTKYRYGIHLIWYPPNMEISTYKYKIYFSTQNSICNLNSKCGMLSSNQNCKELSGSEFYPYSLSPGQAYFNQTFYLPLNFDDKEIEHLSINIIVTDQSGSNNGGNSQLYGVYQEYNQQENNGNLTNLIVFFSLIGGIPFAILMVFVVSLLLYVGCKWLRLGGRRLGSGGGDDDRLPLNNGGDKERSKSNANNNPYHYDVVY